MKLKYILKFFSDHVVNFAASKFRFPLDDLHNVPKGSVDGFLSAGATASNGGHVSAWLTGDSQSTV